VRVGLGENPDLQVREIGDTQIVPISEALRSKANPIQRLDAEADEDDGHRWGFGAAVFFDGDAEALGGYAFGDVWHD